MEACWAHNPEVRGSKPRSANILGDKFILQRIVSLLNIGGEKKLKCLAVHFSLITVKLEVIQYYTFCIDILVGTALPGHYPLL